MSIPDIVRSMAGQDPVQKIADFDRHYMPDVQPAPDVSARGNADDHRSDLKRKADCIFRSLSEVFAYLTHGTSSLEEAKKLLTIITNVNHFIQLDNIRITIIALCTLFYLCELCYFIIVMVIMQIMMLMCLQLDFKPADIKHSSLRTTAKHVRRAMLPDNHEVFQKSFAEGLQF